MLLRRRWCAALLVALLAGCGGGGGGVTPSVPTLNQPVSGAATQTYQFGDSPASYAVPAIGGFSGSLAFPAPLTAVKTTMTLSSSLQAPDGVSVESLERDTAARQTTGTLNFYFYLTVAFPITISFPSVPGFSLTLPKSIDPAGQQFFYAISERKPSNGAEKSFRTQGPAAISGQTLRFDSSSTPLAFEAGKQYTFALYSTSSPATSGATIASVRLSFGHGTFTGNSASGAPTSRIPLDVATFDAAGKTLTGSTPFTNPLILTTSDAKNGALSKTHLTSPNDEAGIRITYSGETAHKILFAASAVGLAPGAVSVELAPQTGTVGNSPDFTFDHPFPLNVTLSDTVPGYSLGYYVRSCSVVADYANCTTKPNSLSCVLDDEAVEPSPPGEEEIDGALAGNRITLNLKVDTLEVAQSDECEFLISDFYGNTNVNDQLSVAMNGD